jgi:DNA polymerase III epsilon subunit-like protein
MSATRSCPVGSAGGFLHSTPKAAAATSTPSTSVSTESQNAETCTGITGCFDMGWQRRGNGRSYASLSGHGVLMGRVSKKIIGFSTRIKNCKKCAYSKNKQDHDCRRNWDGSSKSMEADVAVQLVTNNDCLKKANVHVSTLVGDDDSSTIAKVRSVDRTVKKLSDTNHAKKNLGNMLYDLQRSHKVLSTKVIKYFQKCFGYVLTQNKGDSKAVVAGLHNIVSHAFDKHKSCGDWCGYNADPAGYKHKTLPYGKGLHGEKLFEDLSRIFNKYAEHADSLCELASTQGNESFNACVASKAPKARHYSNSESLDFRVALAVCQHNLGVGYVSSVNKELDLTPGEHTRVHRDRLKIKRDYATKRSLQPSSKRRRLFAKRDRDRKLIAAETREGDTYRSGMAMDAQSFQDNEIISLDLAAKVIEPDSEIIFFDLETTGFGKNAEVVEIAACSARGNFSAYIMPDKRIPEKVSEVTKLTVVNNRLTHNGIPVVCTQREDAWKQFIEYLHAHERPVLVAHNVNFDARFTISEIRKHNLLPAITKSLSGFADTIKLIKKILPKLPSYKQGFLVSHILGPNFEFIAHCASEDVRALSAIVEELKIDKNTVFSIATPFHKYLSKLLLNKK